MVYALSLIHIFTVIYTINSDRAGKQIPLIFDTMIDVSQDDGVRVWVDDKEAEVSKVPSSYENKAALSWIDSLDNHLLYSQENVPNLIGLKYFEVDLSEGEQMCIRDRDITLAIILSKSLLSG